MSATGACGEWMWGCRRECWTQPHRYAAAHRKPCIVLQHDRIGCSDHFRTFKQQLYLPGLCVQVAKQRHMLKIFVIASYVGRCIRCWRSCRRMRMGSHLFGCCSRPASEGPSCRRRLSHSSARTTPSEAPATALGLRRDIWL